MKNIKDYFGTKTAIKCENEQEWEKLKDLCGDRLTSNIQFKPIWLHFDLEDVGCGLLKINNDYTILPYSDFVCDVPELVGVEMEVSHTERTWYKMIVYGHSDCGYLTEKGTYQHARPITKKVLTATLQELAEMLNYDEVVVINEK